MDTKQSTWNKYRTVHHVAKRTISLVNRVSVVCSVNSPSIILDLRDSVRSPCTCARRVIVIYDIKHLNNGRSPLNKGDRNRINARNEKPRSSLLGTFQQTSAVKSRGLCTNFSFLRLCNDLNRNFKTNLVSNIAILSILFKKKVCKTDLLQRNEFE